MKAVPCVLILMAVALPVYAAETEDPLRLAPPNSTALVGIDWKGFMTTPAGQALEAQFNKGTTTPGFPLASGAMDWFRLLVGHVDSVLIAFPEGQGEDKVNRLPLVVVQGKFNVAQLRAQTSKGGRPEVYRSVEMYRSKGAESPSYRVAYPDVNTILMGDRNIVHGAIDRWFQASKAEPSEVVGRARKVMGSGQMWMSATISESMVEDAQGNPAGAALMRELDTVDGVLSFQAGGFSTVIHLGAKSAESAERIAAMVQAALAMIGTGQDPKTADLMKKLQVNRDDTLVRISMVLSQEEMNQLAVARTGSRLPSPAAAPAQPAPRDAKIRIFGLEDGPKEIPLRTDNK